MRKFIPFLLATAGLFAVLGFLFLLIRTDAVPARVRTIHWRVGTTTPPATPVADEAV